MRLIQVSAAILNQICSIDKARLQKHLGGHDTAAMRRVDEALQIILGLVEL